LIELTAEETHFLAAAYGLEVVPGLGPLPLDPEDEASLRLMLGTAARSLIARGLGAYDEAGTFIPAAELEPLFAPMADPEWTASAELTTTAETGSRAWCARDGRAVELARTSDTDYALGEVDDVRERLADFLDLGGDDEREGEPEPADEKRLDALTSGAAMIALATRVNLAGEGVEGVALQWIDPGGDGPVWVVEEAEDDGPATVAPTGRAAVLRQLGF